MTKRGAERATFAEVVAAMPPAREWATVTPESPVCTGSWVDAEGVAWRRSGDGVQGGARLRQLLRDPKVRVLLFADGEPCFVAEAGRERLWTQIRDLARDRPPGVHTEFLAAEFHDEASRRLLMIDQSC